MTNKVYGVDGVDYQAIHDQIGVPMYAIRHAVSRGLLDVNLDTSIALFIAYKSKGDFRDSLNRALIAWDDWKAGRPFLEPSLVSTHTGKPLTSLQRMAIGIAWNNESPTLTNRLKQALAGKASALAVTGELTRKQAEFRRKRNQHTDGKYDQNPDEQVP